MPVRHAAVGDGSITTYATQRWLPGLEGVRTLDDAASVRECRAMDGSAEADVSVDRLRPDEIESGTRLLARSFVGEPLFAYIFEGKDPRRVERAITPSLRGLDPLVDPAGRDSRGTP